MAFTFANLARQVWADLGKIAPLEEFLATGGSTTTIVNAKWADRETSPDDNYCVDYTAIVVRDAGGAAAAPEGEMQRVYLYDSATWTYTVDTAFTVAPASGDRVALANADIPLSEMLRAANRALTDLGDIALVDASLTTASEQTEYTLPVGLKRGQPLEVAYQGNTDDANDNRRIVISNPKVIPAAPGSTGLLVLPQLDSGSTIYITYNGVHPELTTFSSPISETIHPKLAIAATTAHALEWYNRTTSGNNPYWLQSENKAWMDLENVRAQYPIWKPRRAPKFFVLE